MRTVRQGCLGIALCVAMAATAQAQAARPDTGYSKSFECPESLPNKAARDEAVRNFIAWARAAHPDWTLEEFVDYRMRLLVTHKCTATLERIREQTGGTPSIPVHPSGWVPLPWMGHGSHATASPSQSRFCTAA
jgi:hypothetical protein